MAKKNFGVGGSEMVVVFLGVWIIGDEGVKI